MQVFQLPVQNIGVGDIILSATGGTVVGYEVWNSTEQENTRTFYVRESTTFQIVAPKDGRLPIVR